MSEPAEISIRLERPEEWVAVHEARRQGLAMMVIANPAARGFYEKYGFSVEGETLTRFGPAMRMSN